VSLAASFISFFFESETRLGIWVGLTAAWTAQTVAFAALLATVRRRAASIMAGWVVGTFLRLLVIGGLAGLTLGGILALPPEPVLLTVAVALFVLMLLEPVVYHYRLGAR
jgi:hypothetical protein